VTFRSSPRPPAALLVAILISLSLAPARADVFVDVAASAGIDIEHVNGALGKKHLLETINGGAGWIDFDGDSALDIYLVQGIANASLAAKPGETTNRLLRNRGDGTFEDVTEKAGVGDRRYGSGLAVGDVDGDGDSDLYVTNFGRNTLYINRGDGTFEDATEAWGVQCEYWSSSAAFLDVDGDGRLDLYVANYLLYDPEIHGACMGNQNRAPAYCHPNKYDGAPDSLFLNRGDRFEDISKAAGVAITGRILSKGLGVLPTDFDEDGDLDIFVANDSVPNFLWRNLGGGKFEDAALEAGVALNTRGQAEACMGIDGGDVNGDGRQDYFLTNFSEETDSLFLGEGDGFFDDGTLRSGLAQPTFLPLGFGTRLADFDLDGDLDIYVARGHIIDNFEAIGSGSRLSYRQPDQLFLGDGKGRFQDVSKASGAWFGETRVGRAVASADFDSDGDLDLLVVNTKDRYTLLENRTIHADLPAADHPAWIGLSLLGSGKLAAGAGERGSNRDAYGARVRIETPAGLRSFEVRSTASYAASNDPRIVIGLGKECGPAPLVEVEVRWPDGSKQVFRDLAARKYHRLEQAR